MHLGNKNKEHDYHMQDGANQTTLEATTCEKDLGVHVDPTLKFSQHVRKTTNKANSILGMIRRTFDYMDKSMMIQLFKGLIRPILEYGNIIWSPSLKKDAMLIESIQRRATKMVPELKEMEYEDRLRALNLPSLVYRRLRGDLIEAYKLTHGIYNVDSETILPKCKNDRTRGHKYKLEKRASRLDIRKNFYGLRVVGNWNSLPENVVNAPSVNSFKGRLDRILREQQYSIEFPLTSSSQDTQEVGGTNTEELRHREPL